MDLLSFHPSSSRSTNFLPSAPTLFPYYHFVPENYVHWTQTPESHIYSADMPGVKKEEIRVELEDSKYLIIRTTTEEAAEEEEEEETRRRNFNRKFRLPRQVDVEGISADYADGVLTVRVPRSFVRRGFLVRAADLPPPDTRTLDLLARAA